MQDPDEEPPFEFICKTNDENMFMFPIIGLDDPSKIVSGGTQLTGEVVFNDDLMIDLAAGGDYKIEVFQANAELHTEGERVLLVLMAMGPDVQCDVDTPEEMANNVFGICGLDDDCIEDPVNLRSQMLACSGGKMIYNPATCAQACDSPGTCFVQPCEDDRIIQNGVMIVPIDENLANADFRTIIDWSEARAKEILSDYTLNLNMFNIMHVIPDEAEWFGFLSWAENNGDKTAFRDTTAGLVGTQMFAMGRNLGFAYSAQDKSGYMGIPNNITDDGPRICYNAQKSMKSNWYADDSLTVDVLSGENFDGYIVGVDDYVKGRSTSGVHQVFLKISYPVIYESLYLMFNRPEGVNKDNDFFPNTIIIVKGFVSMYSMRQAILNETNNEFSVENFGGSDSTLHVNVCEMNFVDNSEGPDTAHIQIYLDDAMSCSPTSNPTPKPTPSPTREICEDSPLLVPNTGGKGCIDVAQTPSYCAIDGVPSHCPLTCNSCSEHECSDSDLPWRLAGNSYDCDMLKNAGEELIDLYCSMSHKLTKTCRNTCQFCLPTSPTSYPTFGETLAPSFGDSFSPSIDVTQLWSFSE